MSSGTLCLRIEQLESKIRYPPPQKKVISQEPHRSAESRRLVEEYKLLVAAEQAERQRYAVAGSGSNAAASLSSQSKKSLTATKISATPNPHNLISAAESAEENGRIDDAIGCLLEALRLCNATSYGTPLAGLAAEINERLGMHHVDKELYADAIQYFTAGIEVDPVYSRNYLHRAECYVLLDDAASAFQEYEKYFKLELPVKAQLVRCGKCALDAGLLDKAQYYLEQTLTCTHKPSASTNAVVGGNATEKSGQALGDAEMSDASNDAYAYYNLGELEEKRGNDEKARQLFAKVCVVDPSFYVPYEDQAEDEFSHGTFPLALHLFESLAKILPNEAKYFVRLADVYEQLGEEFNSSVLSCLSRALELKQDQPTRESTFVRRGKLLFINFQQMEDAVADFSSCLSMNPQNAEALNFRAQVFRARAQDGDAEAAAQDYKILVSLEVVPFSTKAEPHLYLATDAFSQGDFIAAAKYYSLAHLSQAPLSTIDALRMQVSLAHATIKAGDSFEEMYEPRGWQPRDANEKGKKTDANAAKGLPIVSLAYWTVDAAYTALREREPTMHNELEYQFISIWKPFREEVERKREEADAVRLGKKPKKGK